MTISILTNVTSLGAQRNLDRTQSSLSKNLSRLSSGQRINNASDDAAGLGISERLKADVRSLSQASRNANDGISMTQIAEGSLNEVASILTRIREIATQSSNGSLGDTERGFIQQEFTALRSEIDRVTNVTEFNGKKLLNGSAANLSLQIGIRNTNNDRITVAIATINAGVLALSGTTTLSTQSGAQTSLDTIDTAIATVSSRRASLGALQNRLQIAISNIAMSVENVSAANSRIRDVDIAEETASLTRNQILSQAGAAMLSQANQLPQTALSLLR